MPQETPSAQGAESSVPSSLEECQDLFTHAPIGIFTSTPEGRFISANPAMARMLGYDSSQEMIESITEIAEEYYVDPSDREEFIRLMEEQGEVVNHECRVRRRDGSIIWVSRNARAVRDKNGKLTHYQGFVTDITERKRADQALRESEERFRVLIETMAEGIVFKDASDQYVHWNQIASEIFGIGIDELKGQTTESFKL